MWNDKVLVIASALMTSTTKSSIYSIRFSDGSETRISADTVKTSIASAGPGSANITVHVFELDGIVVAQYKFSDVSGWRIVS